ncbi:glycoside hydrolase family 97 protein [Pedobacter sp. ISL-68]|uniref:glycoside hydrolase family 97 protein n=1 Tax=unclassified Pedobacter TaxID=2628915 RepID=UPI001BE5E218|nr:MULTISPECIES: glycoside hydrolase family 97 protein [unclassified Pedobacter]MBT2560997.1 glycoside hydrolase family 97 protein [Pedobacter sp. ISL-64]MBT2590386.1 glycoside hydrolase family 97 protein [Pedobacter sp. ISL-68]
MKSLFLALNLIFSTVGYSQQILSPNKKIKVVVEMQQAGGGGAGQAYFKVLYKKGSAYIEVLPSSPLGISREDQQFVSNLRLIGEGKAVAVHDKYEMVTGKRKRCENFGTEKTFSYKNPSDQPLDITFKVYNDGVAFMYAFPNQLDPSLSIKEEATGYVIPEGTARWMQPYDYGYEKFYSLNTSGTDEKKSSEWGYPALYKVNNQPLWVLISEAGISRQNCGTKLNNKRNTNLYKVTYPAAKKSFHGGAVSNLPWNSQWHVMIVGGLADLVESTLITDVSEPTAFKDTKWIEPGSVAWVYWAYNHGSKDYKRVIEYIDLAVKMNWPYVLIDWEWDAMANGGTINDALSYARSKGIKTLLWYNSGTDWLGATPVDRLLTHEKREKEFSWLRSMGVSGVKVDFFAGDQQDMMKYYMDILEDAAKYKLLVNFHGATIPRGWARTYPNLMTTEAVYGAEWYNNKPTLTDKAAAHNTTLPFTRNVVGSMDYTPVTFSNSQHPHITSFAHELALAVVFESGLQHFADRPSAYYDLSAGPQNFLKDFPTTWDETKLIQGYPGEMIVIARRKGKLWYVAGLNGKDTPQTLDLNLKFLGNADYSLQLFKDGADTKSITSETKSIKKSGILQIQCLPRGGFAGIVGGL